MEKRTFGGLTIDQLGALGREAGADAVAAAHKAGLPSPGMTRLRFASGAEVSAVTLLHPDGTLEIKDDRVGLAAAKSDDVPASPSRVVRWSKRREGKGGASSTGSDRKVKSA
jgi:hypothetical protein